MPYLKFFFFHERHPQKFIFISSFNTTCTCIIIEMLFMIKSYLIKKKQVTKTFSSYYF